MANINKVIVSGNVTREPELRSTAAGTSVLAFGIAVNDVVRNQSGEWEQYANFFDCTLFGKRADGLARIMSKGDKIAVEGKLRYSTWERDGQRRSKVEIIVNEVELMSRKGAQIDSDGQNAYGGHNGAGTSQTTPQNANGGGLTKSQWEEGFFDEDCPF